MTGGRILVLVGLGAPAIALGTAVALAPLETLVVVAAAVVILAVALHPILGAYILLAATPLLAGIDRGVLIPVLRPNEAVAMLVGAGLVLHAVLAPTRRTGSALSFRFHRIDAALLFLAFSGSVLPLMWMLVRERSISADDIFYALQLWKYYAVFLMVRLAVRTPAQVTRCLWVAMSAAAIVAVIGILQALGFPGAQDFILRYFSPNDQASDFAPNRATSTLGSSFAVADVMIFSLAVAGGLLLGIARHRALLMALGGLFVVGALASGQFSGAIGVVVAAFAFGLVTRRLGRSVAVLAVVAIAAGVALQPVIETRLQGFDTASGLPQSWQGRLDNLNTHFWPPLLSDSNVVTGVRPAGRVAAPESWRDWIYIESGHTWLLWSGGIVFFLAFFAFLAVAMPTVLRIARSRRDGVGVAAIASFTALGVVGVLMTLDPHLTLRGSADLSFSLLALALTDRLRTARSRAAPRRGRRRGPSRARCRRAGRGCSTGSADTSRRSTATPAPSRMPRCCETSGSPCRCRRSGCSPPSSRR